VHVDPVEAADMAKATITSRLPDLDVLQLLRSASVRFPERTIARLGDVLPMPATKEQSEWAASEGPVAPVVMPEARDVIPLHPVNPGADAPVPPEPPPEFLTTVSFTPPAPAHCWSCGEALPMDRQMKYCPFCGADQRQPTCAECGAVAERGWKHCPDCGAKL
jgi:RNA polymerase subunit RPABC4/transcription elongation factor Spt4